MSSILEIFSLSKRYGRLQALQDLNLQIESGTTWGILGPNGSGKTTTLGIVLGVLKPTTGEYLWFGTKPTAQARRRVGTLLETPNFYTYLSAQRNLEIVAAIKGHGQERIAEVLDLVELAKRAKDPISGYSLGMRQRLAVASALLSDPEVLILDEPTNGLDPQGIADVREVIKKTAQTGKTIIMASHILDEVEKVCSHVAVLKQGRRLAAGPLESVLSTAPRLKIASDDLAALQTLASQCPGVQELTQQAGRLELILESGQEPAQINRWFMEQGVALSHLSLEKPSLESGFLNLIREEDAHAPAQH
ncbi:ABC transporter ATP-binding protein [bacterium (Candidatus Blackallbacteria) CG17_big_fil_post_rev_8_21_14_2_50_48_46]|uniref:ABC transporter ATP-binding protein n=1 Tax=bacterium (Candidatus Blackallbacteria) CG17_big_fil_post_rev_8_21_14_2_50_48_46 TaxID=2014261 RepID=A0A2M7G095_9BACT|nr:MAG: ABC transporter ATP-binding protein [bacterium (Candidatus Blackallbacteria) CG18_big_fil_WC_8_21_14_2_50_49_26]PIW14609.1 MAG: ABC transporter ATP-binding protein [bacterium (Candidatus Blackallbacteria) CG17_big_fil_post_rev_8_21_14_2_50_48_46]PIW45660.1 MAG: ABC transporter ATP-binding protein [bacterium (Candidatus Blackallbacteria) CG13_big_fil_rev_8_21_14_2_50_49_14]